MKTIAQQLNIKNFPFEIKDENGKIIYSEDSDGFWNKREYDSNGNKIYHENSDGSWYKKEYDSQGNETYYEDVNGYWEKQELDSKGNCIYFENSEGEIKDIRPKPNIKTPQRVTTLEGMSDKISDWRQDGNTTRLIDRAIQILYNEDICVVLDHRENGNNRRANICLFEAILKRLKNEHEWVLEQGRLKMDLNRLELQFTKNPIETEKSIEINILIDSNF